jgi:hypothetical protein
MVFAVEGAASSHCPDPAHAGFRVWRDGFRGKAPARRQRFRCVNPADRSDWHRFTPAVLRAAAHEHRCLDCQQFVPPNAGPVVPGGYHYLSKVIAATMAAVANGRTYSEASQAARLALDHAAGRASAHGTDYSAHGQLAADWTEVFTEVVVTAPKRWPAVVLLDGTDFYRRAPGGKVPAFTLLFAYGYDVFEGPLAEPEDPMTGPPDRAINGRLLRIGLAGEESAASWGQFLSEWDGTPQVVVGDGAKGGQNAVEATWPGAGVTWVRCVYHWRKNLTAAVLSDLARVAGLSSASATVQEDKLLAPACGAFAGPTEFAAFRDAAHERFAAHREFAELPSLSLNWLSKNAGTALAQLGEADSRPGPQSIGPLEQVIHRARKEIARRAQGLRNPLRTQRMLTLLAAGFRNDANIDIWADLIYTHLAANGSRPALRQRSVVGATMNWPAQPSPKPAPAGSHTQQLAATSAL